MVKEEEMGEGMGARRGRGKEEEVVHIMPSYALKEAGVFRMRTYTECLDRVHRVPSIWNVYMHCPSRTDHVVRV